MDNKLPNGLLQFDFKKGFDLLDHDMLLRICGCFHSSMAWFRSHLSGRSQKTQFRGILSEALPVSVVVPQRSILGPLFVIIHINDLLLELPLGVNSTMFADDTTILVWGPSITSVSTSLNEVAGTVSYCADDNRMSLNTSKTKSLLITTLQKRTTLTSSALNVQLGVRYVEQVHHAKLFGVMIDSSMSWEHHIDTICCIVSGRLSLLRPTKPYLNFDSALRFYNSCVINNFICCSAAWGNCSHYLFLWLLRLQKRAGRILLDADFSSASLPLSLKLKWIPVFYLIKYRKAFLLFSILRNPNASGTDFNFFLIRVDLWDVIQERLSLT